MKLPKVETVSSYPKPNKPKRVQYAEWALLTWTVWTSVFGIYNGWLSIPEIEKTINEDFQGAVTVAPSTLMQGTIGIYILVILISLVVIWGIGRGKHWGRSSLLWGVGLQALCVLLPPYHGMLEYCEDVPDLGLQFYAVYLLYTWPGDAWFNPEKHRKNG